MIIIWNRARGFILGFIIWLIYKTLSLTWKIQVVEPASLKKSLKERKSFILAHFHGDELALACQIPYYRIATITSSSKDGALMTTVVHLLSGKTSRGSSTRGGASALRGLIQFCKNGYNSSFAVDGPKGPIYEIKPGVFELSRLMKCEIYTAGIFCDRAWRFPKAWNKTYLPKPFAKIRIHWTGPMAAITKADDPRSTELAKALQNQLFAARRQAAKVIG